MTRPSERRGHVDFEGAVGVTWEDVEAWKASLEASTGAVVQMSVTLYRNDRGWLRRCMVVSVGHPGERPLAWDQRTFGPASDHQGPCGACLRALIEIEKALEARGKRAAEQERMF